MDIYYRQSDIDMQLIHTFSLKSLIILTIFLLSIRADSFLAVIEAWEWALSAIIL